MSRVKLFVELHGDRASGDASEVRGGLTWMGSHRFVAVEFEAEPLSGAGARKVLRLIRLAEQVSAPVLIVGRPGGVSSGVFGVVRALRAAKVPVTLVGHEWGALANETHVNVLSSLPHF